MSEGLENLLILTSDPQARARLAKLRLDMLGAARSASENDQQNRTVVQVLRDIRERGDEAVAAYTEKFDRVSLRPDEFRVRPEVLAAAHASMDAALLAALRRAIENVRAYQAKIFLGHNSAFSDGTGIRYTPIRRAGVCVPGASAPLPSTVIMTVVPAQVAGVREIAVVSPPRHEGSIHPVILAVCHELGVEEVYRIGGVQAVGALACGTQSIRKVDIIVGPGNSWVQAAKKNVAGDYVGIDSIAGPSEVFIIANDDADPAWVAADMLSQAEHAADSSAVVATDSEALARAVVAQLGSQLAQLPRADEARASLERFSRIIVLADMDAAVDLANEFASEHLEIQCGSRSRAIADRITNAGAIFIGPHTPVAVGDYWAGPSHTLPTGTRAKFSSALTSNDFLKSISLIEYSAERLAACADDIIRLARVEGLDAHARSVQIRL
ncbi:MAG TPA: histidinol dehydrogenase [Sedimentisphaerales bacterium]|nr:histidinol dehydrogenase [Sedimentisphaerales bacterium]HRS13158.1 histidinol dehydrogenase [Sedimentisphaerales bacterium]HRV49718.1 histidinol dehydrogenase [Sedimentisphaerales bacterium]